jgi:hypothetical protein
MPDLYSKEDITREFRGLKFSKVLINGPFDVQLIRSDEERVQITASHRFMRSFSLDSRGDQIILDFDEKNWSANKGSIEIYYKELE